MTEAASINTTQTIKLRRSLKGIMFLLCISAVFVLIGTWMVLEGERKGWLCVIFFGLGVIIAVLQLLPGCSYLVLAPDGFIMCSLYRKHFYYWHEIKEFGSGSIAHNKMVFFNFADDYDRAKLGRRISAGLAGAEGALPDTYGMPAEKLAELMTLYKDRCQSADAPKTD